MSDRERRHRHKDRSKDRDLEGTPEGTTPVSFRGRPDQLASPAGQASKRPSVVAAVDSNAGSDSTPVVSPAAARVVAGPGATVEQRLITMESAVKRMDADLKRGNEFIKQQVKSLERMGNQRFDALDSRNKSLESRIERVGNGGGGGMDDEMRVKVEALLAKSPKSPGRTSGAGLDNEALQQLDMLQRQTDQLDIELRRMTDQSLYEEQRLEALLHQRLGEHEQSVHERLQTSSHAQVAPVAQTQVRGGLPATHQEFVMSAQTPLKSAAAPPTVQTEYTMFAQTQFGQGAPTGLHNTGALDAVAMMEKKPPALDTTAVLEQVQHLGEALSLWASRQKGCERRLAAVEGKLGINGEALMTAPPERKARMLTCC